MDSCFVLSQAPHNVLGAVTGGPRVLANACVALEYLFLGFMDTKYVFSNRFAFITLGDEGNTWLILF